MGSLQILDARSTGPVDRKIPRALTDIAVDRSCRPKLPESSDRETVDRMGRPATEKNENYSSRQSRSTGTQIRSVGPAQNLSAEKDPKNNFLKIISLT